MIKNKKMKINSKQSQIYPECIRKGQSEAAWYEKCPLICRVYEFAKSLFESLFRNALFPGYRLFEKRPEKKRSHEEKVDLFNEIGLEKMSVSTHPSEKNEAFYLDADQFRKRISEVFEVKKTVRPNSKIVEYLLPKKERLEKKEVSTPCLQKKKVEYHFKDPQDAKFYEVLKKLGLLHVPTVKNSSETTTTTPRIFFRSCDQKSPLKPRFSTVLITPGSSTLSTDYYKYVAFFLSHGINVALFDYRGFGDNEGKPSFDTIVDDTEAVYQALKRKKNIKDKELLTVGGCLGGIPAARLAAVHPDIHLMLPLSFGDVKEVGVDQVQKTAFRYIPFISRIVRRIFPIRERYRVIDN